MRRPAASLCLIVLIGLLGLPMAHSAPGAPAVPNEAVVTGEALAVAAVDSSTVSISPPQQLVRLTLRLLAVREVPRKANLLTAGPGDTLEVYSREAVSARLVGKVVTGRVTFRGDERGGRYWISDVSEAAPS